MQNNAEKIILCLLGVCLISSNGYAQTIDIASSTSVNGASVRLRDIARNSLNLPPLWADRIISKAPPPNEEHSISLNAVAAALYKYPDMHSVVLRGERSLKIRAGERDIDDSFINKAANDYINNHPRWAGRQMNIEFEQPELPAMPEGTLAADVKGFRETSEPDHIVIAVNLMIDGALFTTIDLRARLKELNEFWSAATSLPRGHTITHNDIQRRSLPVDNAGNAVPAEINIIGQELTRAVRTDQLLNESYLAPPVYAHRGETVQVISRRGGLTVSLRAKALSTGRQGENIVCLNEASERRITVKLVQPREAVLEL